MPFNQEHVITLTAAGKKFWGTKKKSIRLVLVSKPVELWGGYWQDGSREEYFGKTKSGQVVALSYPTTPREYGGGIAPFVMPTEDMAVCRTGVFCGKPVGITAYVTSLTGWVHESWVVTTA